MVFWTMNRILSEPQGRFSPRSKIEDTPKLSHLIGREQNFGPKEFTLGFMSRAWENKLVLTWPCFPSNPHTRGYQCWPCIVLGSTPNPYNIIQSITTFCGANNIPWNIPIQFEYGTILWDIVNHISHCYGFE
jgi:hypothetical protein